MSVQYEPAVISGSLYGCHIILAILYAQKFVIACRNRHFCLFKRHPYGLVENVLWKDESTSVNAKLGHILCRIPRTTPISILYRREQRIEPFLPHFQFPINFSKDKANASRYENWVIN